MRSTAILCSARTRPSDRPNGRQQRLGLAHLKWLVVRDFALIETATFWKDGPELATGELRTEDIATEVFFLPAANHTEKGGTFTQTQRLLQWHHKALNPPDDAQSELEFFYELGRRIPRPARRQRGPAGSTLARPDLGLSPRWRRRDRPGGRAARDQLGNT